MTRGSLSRGTQAGNANFEIQGSAVQLQQRPTRGGDFEGSGTPSSTGRRPGPPRPPGFKFRPTSRHQQATKQPQPAKQKVEEFEEQQQQPELDKPKTDDQRPTTPIVPTWEGGNLRAPRTPQRPGSAASAVGLTRSASVPDVQRPSSAPAMPTNAEIQAEVKKDPAKWYVPANTYRTQYMEDYSEVPTPENANGAYRPRSVVEVRREMDRRFAKQSMTKRPSTPSMQDLTNYFYTSETTAQYRKFTEKEASDCRGTFCEWQTSKAIQKRTDQVKEELAEARESREARRIHRRPPKVPLKQDAPTSSVQRPKSLADLLNIQKGEATQSANSSVAASIPDCSKDHEQDACSEVASTSADTKEGLSEVGTLDSARTDVSRTTVSSVYSSRSSVSCASSRSSGSTRSSSSKRSGASVRSKSSQRSSSKASTSSVSTSSRSSSHSKVQNLAKVERASAESVCGSSTCSSRPSSTASSKSLSSAVTWSNRSVKTDSSAGIERSEARIESLELDSKCSNQRVDIPALDLDKKPGVPAEEPKKYGGIQPRGSNITLVSRHLG